MCFPSTLAVVCYVYSLVNVSRTIAFQWLMVVPELLIVLLNSLQYGRAKPDPVHTSII